MKAEGTGLGVLGVWWVFLKLSNFVKIGSKPWFLCITQECLSDMGKLIKMSQYVHEGDEAEKTDCFLGSRNLSVSLLLSTHCEICK